MVRRQPRQSLNSSIVSVSESIQQVPTEEQLEYHEFIKRFGASDVERLNEIDLIGYEKTISSIRDRIEDLLTSSSNDLDFALVTGPSGTGKTTVIRKLANEFATATGDRPKLTFFYLRASWILKKQFGNLEQRLSLLFEEAVQKAPSLIFIDRVDLICAEKKFQNDARDRILNELDERLENLELAPAKVMVLAATNRAEVLEPRFRNTYFSDEIRFSLPSRQDRIQVLNHLIKQQDQTNLAPDQIESIADLSHCYRLKELTKLYKMALKHCKQQNDGVLDLNSFRSAVPTFKPIATKSVTSSCPPLRWEDIGGVDKVKKKLHETVVWFLEQREEFQKLGVPSNKGVLLYGPPGCSKTMLAHALATESGYNFISIKGPELLTKFVGDSEAAVRTLYKNARDIAPCIIFFDEIDGFASERNDNQSSSVGDKVVCQLLTEFNNTDNVFTIAATNRPDRVDSALLRPGRLDPAIYIPLPSEEDRRAIFKVHMRPMMVKFGDDLENVLDKLAARTCNYSGADIAKVYRAACTVALRKNLSYENIDWNCFEESLDEALEEVKPSTRMEQLKAYGEFQKRYIQFGSGSAGAKSSPSAHDNNGIMTNVMSEPSVASQASVPILRNLMRSFRIRKRSNK